MRHRVTTSYWGIHTEDQDPKDLIDWLTPYGWPGQVSTTTHQMIHGTTVVHLTWRTSPGATRETIDAALERTSDVPRWNRTSAVIAPDDTDLYGPPVGLP